MWIYGFLVGFQFLLLSTVNVWGINFNEPSQEEDTPILSQMGGEAFQTDLFTGSGSTSVPIVVPPGTHGIQPNLALVYNSASRTDDHSIIGTGWNLQGLGYIEWSTKYGVPDYNVDPFTMVFNGSHDLIFVSQDATYWNFHTQQETFLRIQYEFTNSFWIVTDKTGTQYRFGSVGNSKTQGFLGNTRRWAIDQVMDTHGNYMSITYDNSANGEIYPQSITYTQGNGLTTFRTVEFYYETRPDQLTIYRYGTPGITLAQRLDYIDVKINNALVRRYDLTYEESTDSKESLLKQITEYGSDAISNPPGISLPPVSYTYSIGGNSFQSSGTWMNATVHETTNFKVIVYLADYSGDGKSDVVYCQGNIGKGRMRIKREQF